MEIDIYDYDSNNKQYEPITKIWINVKQVKCFIKFFFETRNDLYILRLAENESFSFIIDKKTMKKIIKKLEG
jgi:hypothetical protein